MTMLMMICWFSKPLAMMVVCCDNDGADDNNDNDNNNNNNNNNNNKTMIECAFGKYSLFLCSFIACFCIVCFFPPVTVSKLTSRIATPSSRNVFVVVAYSLFLCLMLLYSTFLHCAFLSTSDCFEFSIPYCDSVLLLISLSYVAL